MYKHGPICTEQKKKKLTCSRYMVSQVSFSVNFVSIYMKLEKQIKTRTNV